MKRAKRHKIKHEKPETSSAFTRAAEEQDLAYYIHDRVELMHQVFSVLKTKDIRAMAPECVRRLTIDDLQELCTEELLGISSKRLLAILDGAEPPSDTESSSQSSEHVEAISLDSISSDEEILSQLNKKKRKHKHQDSKSKKHKSKKAEEPQGDQEKSKASRAGLTVLELLELQARARAIRAQLQQEQARRTSEAVQTVGVESSQSSDSDIEVKEEPAEVVEIISSDDEKPKIHLLENAAAAPNKEPEKTASITTATVADPGNKDSGKSKNKKDKSKKKEKKQKESIASKDSDKIKEVANKESDKPNETTDQSTKDSTASIEIDTTAKNTTEDKQRVTKRVNDLIITVPQQTTRKIKLNRNKMTVSIANNAENQLAAENTKSLVSVMTRPEKPDNSKKVSSVVNRVKTIESVVKAVDSQSGIAKDKNIEKVSEKGKNKDKSKKKPKKKEKRQSIDEDHDEITLQLSDSEKMDLLENFDKRNYDDVSSSSSDSESSSDSDNSKGRKETCKELDKSQDKTEKTSNETNMDELPSDVTNDDSSTNVGKTSVSEIEKEKVTNENSTTEILVADSNKTDDDVVAAETDEVKRNSSTVEEKEQGNDFQAVTDVSKNSEDSVDEENNLESQFPSKDKENEVSVLASTEIEEQNVIVISKIDDIPVQDYSEKEMKITSDFERITESLKDSESKESNINTDNADQNPNQHCEDNKETTAKEGDRATIAGDIAKESDKELSEGELSEHESSEVEALELQPEVVCISDEETPKKKKKKDKKSKKEKKKKSDFRESADQNFFKDTNELGVKSDKIVIANNENVILDNEVDDDVYEILELSDDSSCYEVEGTTLSKEPTVEEIAALSAKIDDIEREEIVTEKEIEMHEKMLEERKKVSEENNSNINMENVSWKDRYLDSKKVRRVLTTSNILNALRKKNKELKKKMEESKREQELRLQKESEEKAKEKVPVEEKDLEEGSIEHFNTLEASTKYVDPVPDPVEIAKMREEELKEIEKKEAELIKEKEREVEEAIEAQVTGEMKKDAKQLLKMYKKLLKYNDIKKQKDPNKKKSKRKKKKEKDSKPV